MSRKNGGAEPLDRRALEALGRSYVEILAPYLTGIGRGTPTVWKVRKTVPVEHRPKVREAIERHWQELGALLAELDEAGWGK